METVMANVVVWADIPVVDMDRARAFYAKVLGGPVDMMPGMTDVALLMPLGTGDPSDVSGDLVVGDRVPSTTHGVTLYLSAMGDIDGMLSRVVAAGGTIEREKGFMGEGIGWIAYIHDSEGNRIGIQQPA
jgi:predicted enzyme related to lactoylglutathione lyase